MGSLKRYYNQNRKKIWGFVIIIASVLMLIQIANGIARSNSERQIAQAEKQMQNNSSNINNQSQTSTSGKNTQNSQNTQTNSKVSTINKFIDYCNKKDLESAYNMLTDDCKNKMFGNIETFEEIYYNNTFENKSKEAEIEKWSNNTYIVTYTENALATGKIATTKEEQKVDYITVAKDEDENYKLNINSYIGYKEINANKETDGIKIEVLNKNTYMNYETYTINVTNNSGEDIELDSLYDAETIYLEDINSVKYPAYSGELSGGILKISSGHKRQLKIKFFSSYVSTKQVKQLVFSDIWKNRRRLEMAIDL